MYFIINKHGKIVDIISMTLSCCRFNKFILSKISKLCSRQKHELAGKWWTEIVTIPASSKILEKVDFMLTYWVESIVWSSSIYFSEKGSFTWLFCLYEACCFFVYLNKKLKDHLPICFHKNAAALLLVQSAILVWSLIFEQKWYLYKSNLSRRGGGGGGWEL